MEKLVPRLYLGVLLGAAALFATLLEPTTSEARDLEYENEEISIYVSPGEPTQIQFPENITGGFKRKLSALNLERRDRDLIVFATEGISEVGEAIIVRLGDGRSYSVRQFRKTCRRHRNPTNVRLDLLVPSAGGRE